MGARGAPILEPEDLADYFKRNPELGRRAPDVAAKVSDALKAKAAAHQAAASIVKAEPRPATSSSSGPSTLESIGRTTRQLDQLAPGSLPGRSSVVSRLIVAFFAAIAVLELVSYATGQYFRYDLKAAPKNAAAAATYIGLYGAQHEDLAKIRAASSASSRSQSQGQSQGQHPSGLPGGLV